MKNPLSARILSVGAAVGHERYTQRQVFDELGYPERYWRIFRKAGIDERYFTAPLSMMRTYDFQTQQEHYGIAARGLCLQAIMDCLDGRPVEEIGALSFSSCTGIMPGPVMGHYLIKHLGLRPDIYIMNNLFQGCDAAFPGLRRCVDYTMATGDLALVVTCELSSCTYYPEKRGANGEPDPEGAYQLLRAYALFADGASCALIGSDYKESDVDPKHPRVLDTETCVDIDYLDHLGYRWKNGRLWPVISRRVPQAAAALSGRAVGRLLQRWGIQVGAINYWIIHPAGAVVLDLIRDELGIDEAKMIHSREALRRYGNCSSASVGIIAKMLMQAVPEPEGPAVMLNIGPGMTADATLLEFN